MKAGNPWSYHQENDAFTCEISTLDGYRREGKLIDPWNRPLPARSTWQPDYSGQGEDREVAGWRISTTVAGVHIELTLIAD